MSKKLKISSIVLVLLVVSYFFASPYLTLYQVRQAIEQEDSVALASHIDFPSVRQSLKDQVNTRMLQDMPQVPASERGLATLGTILASSMLDKVIDSAVTSQGVGMLLQGKKLRESLPLQGTSTTKPETQTAKDQVRYQGRYQLFNQFALEIQYAYPKPPITVIMQRQGLSWKITQILLPNEQLK